MLPSYANAGPLNVAQAYDRALTLRKQGRFNEAEQLYAQVLAARPDHVDALHMMGVVNMLRGNCPRRCGSSRPRWACASRRRSYSTIRAWFRTRWRRPEEALASFEQAIKLKSKFADAHKDRGVVLVGLGRHEEAPCRL